MEHKPTDSLWLIVAFVVLVAVMFPVARAAREEARHPHRQVVRQKQPKESEPKGGLGVGPKMRVGPSFNFSTGEFELLPSFHPGPRVNFD